MRTIIYKNYAKSDDVFNIKEIKAKKYAFIFWIINICIMTSTFIFHFYNGLMRDLGYVSGDVNSSIGALDYNLKELSV
jgi:hypothetical protein